MSKIFLESKVAIEGQVDQYHMYIVYQDDNGKEFVIRGGQFVKYPSFDYDNGNIIAEAGVPIEYSMDSRGDNTPAQRNQVELDLKGRDAEDVWNLMVQQANNITDSKIKYEGYEQNSNSTVASVLQTVGIDVYDNLPTGTSWYNYPALDKPLMLATDVNGTADDDVLFGYDMNDTLNGANGNDYIIGDSGNDRISGGNGNDSLFGGVGRDVIRGDSGNDDIIGAAGADILTGGSGADTFHFRNLADSTKNATDWITDFEAGIDKIDISDTSINSIEELTISENNGLTTVSHARSNFEINISSTSQIDEADFIF